ncbi:Hypothetical protein LLA12_00465 [Lactococcus lactis subsp. lactis]|nr:Hypothetical protein LLA12_00465 [Lactococcus lactis subsp. lactis]
MPKNNQIYC